MNAITKAIEGIEDLFYGPNLKSIEANLKRWDGIFETQRKGKGIEHERVKYTLHKTEEGYYSAHSNGNLALRHLDVAMIIGGLAFGLGYLASQDVFSSSNIALYPGLGVGLTFIFSRTIYQTGLIFKEKSLSSIQRVGSSFFGTLKGLYCLPLTFGTSLYGIYNPVNARSVQAAIRDHWYGGREILTLGEVKDLGFFGGVKAYLKADKVVSLTQLADLHCLGGLNSTKIELVKQKKAE